MMPIRLSPPSLLARIILRLSLATLVAIACAYGWLWFQFQTTAAALRDSSLIETARTIAGVVGDDGQGGITVALPHDWGTSFAGSDPSHGFAIRDRDSGTILYAAGVPTGPIPRAVWKIEDGDEDDGILYRYDPDGPGPYTYFGDAFPFLLNGRHLLVQVVRRATDDQALIETVVADFFEDGGWLAGPFLLLLLVVSILTVRGTLKPLRDLSALAGTIGPQNTTIRLPLKNIPREVTPLVRAVNQALDRLEDGYRQQKEFTADAAHELRTPLAVLSAHIDILTDRQVAASLRRDLQGMTHLVEQLLRIARTETLVLAPDEHTDLTELAQDAAAWLAPMAIAAKRMIEIDAPDDPVIIHGQRDALFHALRNLLDNALRHTPPDTTITITVQNQPPRLMVRDHGPGVPLPWRGQIFQRFWRGERQGSGTGLGLAIVQRTMRAHGGRVCVDDAPGGGALFTLTFPNPPETSPQL